MNDQTTDPYLRVLLVLVSYPLVFVFTLKYSDTISDHGMILYTLTCCSKHSSLDPLAATASTKAIATMAAILLQNGNTFA